MAAIKIDNHSFDADHYSKYSEADFIKELIVTVPDKYGTKENKTDFLKICYKAIKATQPAPAATVKK